MLPDKVWEKSRRSAPACRPNRSNSARPVARSTSPSPRRRAQSHEPDRQHPEHKMTNQTAPKSAPAVVWSVAGSDSGGGAGLQADLRAIEAFGAHACTVVAAITAQNSVTVQRIEPVSPALLEAQPVSYTHLTLPTIY